MAECPGGRTNRGIRSQFRLGTPAVGLFRGLHPVLSEAIMDYRKQSQQSSQTGVLSARDLVSPSKGTRTLTVREYEQTIDELKKENFDVKLRFHLLEECMKKFTCKDKDGCSQDKNCVEIVVQLKLESEYLRKDLADTLEQVEKYKVDFKALEEKYTELQNHLSSLSELPSNQEFLSLLEEKENLIKQTELLEQTLIEKDKTIIEKDEEIKLLSKQELSLLEEKENLIKQTELLEQTLIEKDKTIIEKDEEIKIVNGKIEILANLNTTLEEKIRKRSLAIQGFVYKDRQEKEMFPDELRNVVLSASQAAKNQNKENLAVAVKSFNSVLNQIMSSSVQKLALNESEEKENIRSPQAKCLEEECLEKSSTFLPSETESFVELNRIQSLKEVLTERNTLDCKQIHSLEPAVHNLYMKGKGNESYVNNPEKDILECTDFSTIPLSSVPEESLLTPDRHRSQISSVGKDNLVKIESMTSPLVSSDVIPLSSIPEESLLTPDKHKSQLSFVGKDNLVKIESMTSPLVSSDVIHEEDGLSKSDASLLRRTSKELDQLLKENEKLKVEVKDKLSIIEQLSATCKELEQREIHLQEKDALKASKCFSVYTQTDMTGSIALNEYEMKKLQNDAKLSNNVDELREDVLLLLLAIEDKNKELGDVKETLSAVQEDLNRALNTSSNLLDKEYANERNELHERLAFSCSVNIELMKHLRNLEAFMEDLLQHKFDSSRESISEKSDFLSNVSKCLNESLKLSNVLSDHLTICEGSKLFEDCESVFFRSASYADEKSLPNFNLSEVSASDQHSSTYPGTQHLEEYIPFVRKNDERMSKELDDSQLCWRCWQQLDSTLLNKSEASHLMQNVSPKFMPYPSSDSDIWSEPDRNISMQRIGISLQNSPVASKSPRKLRFKEKRMSNKLSSDVNTSSSEMHRWSKQRRHGSVSRRLFPKESIKNLDFTSEKFYFLLAEKYTKMKTLLEALENLKDTEVSDEVWIKMKAVVACLGEALQKLHIAKENGKNLPSAICGKCIMLELFMDLKSSHKSDFCVDGSLDDEILQQFQREVNLLKEMCKETFSFLVDSADVRSRSTQSDTASDSEQVKISELEDAIVDLNDKNKTLSRNMEEVKRLLCKEKELLESVNLEKSELSHQISSLEEELMNVKQKENELSLKNEELVRELEVFYTRSSKQKFATEDQEEQKKVSSAAFEELTAELQKDKLDLINMKVKCVEYEKQLNEQMQLKQQIEDKLKNLESTSLSEKETLNNNIKSLELEKHHYQKELGIVENRKFILEKENASLNANLKSKCREISSLQETINMLKTCKEISQFAAQTVDRVSHSTQCDFDSEEVKMSDLKDAIVDVNDKNKSLSRSLEETERLLSEEKGMLDLVKADNFELSEQVKNLKEDILITKQKEKELSLKNEDLVKELANVNKNNFELSSTLKNLEEKRIEASDALNQLASELEKSKSDLVSMSKKCMEYEKQLNKHLIIKEEYEKKLNSLHSDVISGKALNSSIRDIWSEKSSFSLESESAINREKVKIKELESEIANLNDKNENLNKNLEAVKIVFSKEREMFESLKSENWDLSNEINNLKRELLAMKQREEEVCLKNNKLLEDMMRMKKNNSELNSTLQGLEVRKRMSTAALDQLTADLEKNKLDLVNMNMKCLEYEKELNEQLLIKEECEKKFRSLESSSVNEKETLCKNISHLNSEKDYYQKQLKCIESEKLALQKENTNLSAILKSKCNELFSLQEQTQLLEEAKETLSYNYEELQNELENTKKNYQNLQKKCCMHEDEVLGKLKANQEEFSQQFKKLETESLLEKEKLLKQISELQNELENTKKNYQNLQKKCCMYEEELLGKLKANQEEFSQQFKKLEAESLLEKEKLLKQISELTLEREAIFKKLKEENECYEKLLAEKKELNSNLADSLEQISSLKLLNDELKGRQKSLLQRNEFFENALLSSNSECNSLSNDLKCLRQTLQILESKCMAYEKEIAATAGMKDSLVDCLLSISSEFSNNRQKLNEMCKVYGKETCMDRGEASVSNFIPVIDENNVKKLCEHLCLESKKLLQSVDVLLELLRTFHSRARETTKVEEKSNLKTSSLRKEMEFHKAEREHTKSQNDHLQQVIDELQKSILKKEKSIQQNVSEIQSLKEKMHKSEEEIQRGKELLKRKDDEIIKLQEKVFNLQSYINTIMTNKTNEQEKTLSTTKKFVDDIADSLTSDSQLPSSSLKKVSAAVQTIEYENTSLNTDESALLESGKHTNCEKYVKKCHSLQTKLTLLKKHVEILEKEKNDLQERYLSQLQSKNSSVSDTEESVNAKLVDLESKLEQKKAFIRELKADLLKTCNSLIDKQREVDDLKDKLSEYERKPKCSDLDTSDHSISSPKTVDSKVKSLRNYKWTLIQTIFDIQRQFYEKKGIHLNYFDTFKDHVNNLYSMQLSHSLSKAESMPILGSNSLKHLSSQGEDKIKNMVGLELDIQCLENLKIFLNRFFVPCVLQSAQNIDLKPTKLESVEKKLSPDKLSDETEKVIASKLEKISSLGVSFPECVSDHLFPEHVQSSQHLPSFESFVSNVSHHLDCIENFFSAVKKCQWLESYDLSTKESLDKMEAKSLLFNVFEEVGVLQEGADKLFSFNALLKNYDFVAPTIPYSFSRSDVSDKESVMSEETIGISRSESPLSFEELCPVKLPSPETLTLEENTMKPQSLGGRGTVNEAYSAKVTAIESSCDSVCQRSHYSSPDLGIESDPNHESSAPEQKEEAINKYSLIMGLKPQQKTAFTSTESAGRFTGIKFGQTLYSIGELPHYELLKREIQESLVGIKSVLSRTGDGLHHVAKYTSPRKTLEYSTLKAIKDSCANIEVCLKEAYTLVGKFWIAACPSEKEWKALLEENQQLIDQLTSLRAVTQKQKDEFKRAMGRLEHAQLQKASMEKKISKKLVKTKKVIRQAELKLLENRCQNLRPVPKYPSEQAQQKENV